MNAKSGAQERLQGIQKDILSLSHRIHANPELGFEEEKASNWLAEMLADAGMDVKLGICDLPTAFVARAERARCTSPSAPSTTACLGSVTRAVTTLLPPWPQARGSRSRSWRTTPV